MSTEYKKATENLVIFKRTYDKYAGELIALRNNVPVFVSPDEIASIAPCNCFSFDKMLIGSYPAVTSSFFGHTLIVCGTCGGSFIPKLQVDLDDYYTNKYQADVQSFRLNKSDKFYEDFQHTDTYSRFSKRAELLLELGGDSKRKSILDIGCGVGVLLRLSKARNKCAIEPDPHSQKILVNELGVTIIDENDKRRKFDAVYLSHVVEHYDVNVLPLKIQEAKKFLKADGKIVIAVPDGAYQLKRLMAGNRDKVLFEPHTINFSLKMLCDTLVKLGLKIETASIAPSTDAKSPLYKEFIQSLKDTFEHSEIVVVATHAETKYPKKDREF